MTNGDKIRNMNDKQLAEFFDILLDQDREDWTPIGCYDCAYYGTHHQEDGDCNNCEWENGIEGWLKRKAQPNK